MRLNEDKIKVLDKIADMEERSRNHLLNDALDNYLEMKQAWIDGINEALEDIEAGRVHSYEEVMKEFKE
jgi:predicted transcriptional regulator